MANLERQFHTAMLGIYEIAKKNCNYNATRFLAVVNEKGGYRTAQTLLGTDKVSEGLTAIWECGRLDLTVEALVLRPEFAPLFTAEEKATATKRLKDYGYKFP